MQIRKGPGEKMYGRHALTCQAEPLQGSFGRLVPSTCGYSRFDECMQESLGPHVRIESLDPTASIIRSSWVLMASATASKVLPCREHALGQQLRVSRQALRRSRRCCLLSFMLQGAVAQIASQLRTKTEQALLCSAVQHSMNFSGAALADFCDQSLFLWTVRQYTEHWSIAEACTLACT